MIKNRRKKPTLETEADVMFKSDCKCCVCQKRGDHIHHIDEIPSNSQINNLALLCFEHHNEATIKGSLRKKLSSKTIIKYRDYWYSVVETKRKKDLKTFDAPIKQLTEENLLTASKNAIIIIDILKIEEEFHDADWNEREKVINKLFKYSEHST